MDNSIRGALNLEHENFLFHYASWNKECKWNVSNPPTSLVDKLHKIVI